MVVVNSIGRALRRVVALAVLGLIRGRRVLVPAAGLLLVAYVAVLAVRPALLPPSMIPGRGAAPSRPSVAATTGGQTVVSPGLGQPASPSVEAAIRQVIQRADIEQAQALASKNPVVMQDTATDGYYQEAVQTNQDLLDGGVASIALNRIEWGPITVSGDTATAVTYETWTTEYANGQTEQARDMNIYALTRQNGSWLILSDDHPNSPSSAQGNGGGIQIAPAPAGQGR